MGMLKKPEVDETTKAQIEADMQEQEKSKPAKVSSTTCDCTGLSPDGTPGTGLLDAHTQCPRCKGTGKLAVLG